MKIVSGSDKGKTGSIIKIEGKQAVIFTNNENQIKVPVNNLMIWNGPSAVADDMKEDFKKFDLIKTVNAVGIVLVVEKETLKILDTNNSIKVISILDFDTKLDTRKNTAKNSYNEIIKNGAIVSKKRSSLRVLTDHSDIIPQDTPLHSPPPLHTPLSLYPFPISSSVFGTSDGQPFLLTFFLLIKKDGGIVKI